MRLALACLLLALPALAQLDSAAVRAKFGPPLNRETFRVRPGLEIAVDYRANQQVCSIEVPVLRQPEREALLTELAPDATRGKELSRSMTQMSLAWVSTVEYEHVTISESGHGDTRGATSVRFTREDCR